MRPEVVCIQRWFPDPLKKWKSELYGFTEHRAKTSLPWQPPPLWAACCPARQGPLQPSPPVSLPARALSVLICKHWLMILETVARKNWWGSFGGCHNPSQKGWSTHNKIQAVLDGREKINAKKKRKNSQNMIHLVTFLIKKHFKVFLFLGIPYISNIILFAPPPL